MKYKTSTRDRPPSIQFVLKSLLHQCPAITLDPHLEPQQDLPPHLQCNCKIFQLLKHFVGLKLEDMPQLQLRHNTRRHRPPLLWLLLRSLFMSPSNKESCLKLPLLLLELLPYLNSLCIFIAKPYYRGMLQVAW